MRTPLIIILTLVAGFQLKAQETAEGSPSILRNAFHLEGTLKGGMMRQTYDDQPTGWVRTVPILNIGVQMGSKWYFTHGNEYRTGLALTWLRTEFGVDPSDFGDMRVGIDAVHLGWANIWKCTEELAIEANIGGGLSLHVWDFELLPGFQISPEVKLRTKKSTLGLGYAYFRGSKTTGSQYTRTKESHELRFTVGLWH